MNIAVSSVGKDRVGGQEAGVSPDTPLHEKDVVSAAPQHSGGGKGCGSSDHAQSKAQKLASGGSQPRRDNTAPMLELEDGRSLTSQTEKRCGKEENGNLMLQRRKRIQLAAGIEADERDNTAAVNQSGDHLATTKKLLVVGGNCVQTLDLGSNRQPSDLSEKEKSRHQHIIQESNGIQPLDLCPIKIRPLDRYAFAKTKILQKTGWAQQAQMLGSFGEKFGPYYLDSKNQNRLQIKNAIGPNTRGLQKLNAQAATYQPVGLQGYGLQTAGPSQSPRSICGPATEKEGFIARSLIDGLAQNSFSEGNSNGPVLLEDLVGPETIVPINSKGEIIVAHTRKNYLHLKDSLLQFLQGRGIPLTSFLKNAIIQFLSNSGTPIFYLSRDQFKWDALQKYFFLHLRNLNFKITLSFRCAIEQFFQFLETILLEKNLKVACDSPLCSPPRPSIDSDQDQNFFDSPVLAFPQIEGPPQECSSVAFSEPNPQRISFKSAIFNRLNVRYEKRKNREANLHPLEEMGPEPFNLNQKASPPSTQSQFQPRTSNFQNFLESGDFLEQEYGHEDFDEFVGHGMNFAPGYDSGDSWESEDSGTKHFLKGKWKQDYTMRASTSKRSL